MPISQHLKDGIQKAEETLAEAERKGMEVSQPEVRISTRPQDALTNARTQIHSFKVDVVEKALADGEKVLIDPDDPDKASRARPTTPWRNTSYRRYWLAISLVPILIVIGLLVLYIRSLPIPEKAAEE